MTNKSLIIKLNNGLKVKAVKECENVYSYSEIVKTGYGHTFEHTKYYQKTKDGNFVEIAPDKALQLINKNAENTQTQSM
ncbi:MAG: hypothetical protein ACOX6H_04055 [Christensenellales bacterium]|jgi:hypothetical protein